MLGSGEEAGSAAQFYSLPWKKSQLDSISQRQCGIGDRVQDMRTGSFIVGLLQERTGVLGVSLSVSFSYYISIAAQPKPAGQRSRPRCLASVTKYLGSVCRRYVRGPWGRIKGRLEDPSGLGSAWIASLDVSLTAVTVGGLPGWDGWWYFDDYHLHHYCCFCQLLPRYARSAWQWGLLTNLRGS